MRMAVLMFVLMAMRGGVAVEVGHVVIVVFVRGIQHDVEVAGVEAGLLHARDPDLKPADRQTCQRPAQHSLVRAKVKQRRRNHVAADAGATLQIQCLFHSLFSLSAPAASRLIWVARYPAP